VVIVLFMGRYNHTIDPKGRLSIPSKYRETLGEEFVVSKGMDGCLFVYAIDDWKVFEAKLASLPLINQEARQFARFFLSGAQYVTLDKQGRILMPADLRGFAGLEKDVVLAGMGGRIEIWSLEKWEENSAQVDINEISQGMISLGLTI
jgi:MraZ protein